MGKDIKVKLELSKTQKALAEKIVKAKLKLVEDNIEAVMKKEAIPHLIDLIMDNYDKLSDRMDTLPQDDPTNPANWRDVFKAKLEQDAADTFIYDRADGVIKVNLGEKSYLGYGEDSDTSSNTPLVWMVYYLEGLAGSWGWITKEVYEAAYPAGAFDPQWGRFRNAPGFMLSGGEFFSRKNPWRKHVTWSEIRHPFSAYSPMDIFAEALNEFKIRPYINKAIQAALAGKKL